MRAYTTIRLIQYPDVADLRAEARPTHCARTDGRSIFRRSHIKRATRRYLKHRDKMRAVKDVTHMLLEEERQEIAEFLEMERHYTETGDYY